MYLQFILYSIVIIIVLDLYFYRSVKSWFAEKRIALRQWVFISYWVFSIFSVVFFAIASYYYIQKIIPPRFLRIYVAGFIFILLASKLFGSLFLLTHDFSNLVKYTRNKLNNNKNLKPKNRLDSKITRKDFLKKTALIAAALPFASFLYGMFKTAYSYNIKKVILTIPNLPKGLKGIKIVQLSDIHAGSFLTENPLKEIVSLVNKQNPDIFFFTGDLVNELTEEAIPFASVLGSIKAKIGKFSILGNHDYGDYFYQKDDIEGKAKNKKLMINLHRKMGWNILLNENRILEINGEKIAIIGVENWGNSARFQRYGDLEKACNGCNNVSAKLLLSHDPSHWDAEIRPKRPDIDVTFSGHTHGMQFGIDIPFVKWSPVKYLYPQWSGLYKTGTQQIYVNPGIGFIGYPGRVGIEPEITVFELA
jgi:predicted MPP superfamily phosphohydrolase